MPRAVEQFSAYGHPEVTATHRTTFEITVEEHLSPAGTCIIAVRSEKGAVDLSTGFKDLLRSPGCHLITVLECGDTRVTVTSSGSPDLLLDHSTDLVWRRSSFTCGRTIGLYSDYTAVTLPREMITLLRAGRRLDVTLIAELDTTAADSASNPTLPWFSLFMEE
jgi:uncharacterized protein